MKSLFSLIVKMLAVSTLDLGLTSCTISPNFSYTGDAVVNSRHSDRFYTCRMRLLYPDGEYLEIFLDTEDLRKSNYPGCYDIKEGAKVSLANGKVVSIEKND